MFIRRRHVKGRNGKAYEYFSIVETRRENGKVKQAMLYNMGKRATIAECIAEAQKRLEHWLKQDQHQLEAWCAMAGMRVDPDHVVKQRARWQEEIDWLKDAATKV